MANQISTPEGVLSALSDPTNRQVVQNLRNGELSLGDLTEQLLVSRPAVSQHLRVLSHCGSLTASRHGASRGYAIATDAVAELRTYQDLLWDDALASWAHAVRRRIKQQAGLSRRLRNP